MLVKSATGFLSFCLATLWLFVLGILAAGCGRFWGGLDTNATSIKYVFVTSTTSNGNMGGLAGADAVCQARAGAAGLPGTWVAYLSTSTVNAVDRITIDGPWHLVDGTLIFSNKAAMTSSGASNTIKDEFGNSQVLRPWTGSLSTGTVDGVNHCVDWTSPAVGPTGRQGGNVAGTTWASCIGVICNPVCSTAVPIYCFQL